MPATKSSDIAGIVCNSTGAIACKNTASKGAWHLDQSFNAADALLNDEGLGGVFKAAIDRGYAVVTRSS
jgi:hypothetical protein